MRIDIFPCRHSITALILLALPAVVLAQFTFTTNNGSITITGYTGPGGAVVIPACINGYTVNSIGGDAFDEKVLLTAVIIPDSVTSIGDTAFEFCSGLTNITMPSGLTSIGELAFLGCSKLASVTIPDSVTNIGEQAFRGCGLTSIKIPDSLASIAASTFATCYSLTNVAIPNSVTNIGDDAFDVCTHLTSVTIPDSVTSIGAEAFESCGLASVTIPASVTSVGVDAFSDCTDMTHFAVDGANRYFSSLNGVLFDKAQDTLVAYPGGLTSSTYVIPNSVANIGYDAFTSTSSFSDPQWTNYPNRYYRFSAQQPGIRAKNPTESLLRKETTKGNNL